MEIVCLPRSNLVEVSIINLEKLGLRPRTEKKKKGNSKNMNNNLIRKKVN
jgi:hypothetical protein